MWNHITDLKIKQLKIAIVKKKLMLSFIVDTYAWWDSMVRWIQFLILIISPIVAFISMFVDDKETITIIIIILNGISIGVVRLKDYLGYDKIRDVSKEQTLNYGKLYDYIERELLKDVARRQDASEFINSINQEYNNIGKKDPELSYGDNNKFKEFCKNNNIPYDEDMDLLKKLIAGSRAELRRKSVILSGIAETQIRANETQVKSNEDQIKANETQVKSNEDQIKSNGTQVKSNEVESNEDQIKEHHIIDVTPEVSEEPEESYTDNVPEYHQILSEISNPKTFNSKKDIKWAMSRLESLETGSNYDQ